MQARRRAGLRSFPCSLGEDHLVQSQIRDCAPKTGVLRLQILHPLDLIAPQPAVLLTPAIIRHLSAADVDWPSFATISSSL